MEESRSDQIADRLFNLFVFAFLIVTTGGVTVGITLGVDFLMSKTQWLERISPKYRSDLGFYISVLFSMLLWIWAFKFEVSKFYLEKISVIQSIRSEENRVGLKTAKWFFFSYISIMIALTLFDIVRDLFFS